MTCGDVEHLLDAFADGELPGTELIAVARHAGSCPACERTVRELSTLRESVAAAVDADAAALDLSSVWPAVAAAATRVDARRAWVRRLRAAPVWGAAAALAAATVLWLRTPPEPQRIAARPSTHQVVIDRLDSDSAWLELRREPKHGMTLIMVSADVSADGRGFE